MIETRTKVYNTSNFFNKNHSTTGKRSDKQKDIRGKLNRKRFHDYICWQA